MRSRGLTLAGQSGTSKFGCLATTKLIFRTQLEDLNVSNNQITEVRALERLIRLRTLVLGTLHAQAEMMELIMQMTTS
jgi:hypothetical protein